MTKYFMIRSRSIYDIQETAIKNRVWYSTEHDYIKNMWKKWKVNRGDICVFFASEGRFFYLIAKIIQYNTKYHNKPCIKIKPLHLIRNLKINEKNYKKFDTFKIIKNVDKNFEKALQGSRMPERPLGDYGSENYDGGLKDYKCIIKNGKLEYIPPNLKQSKIKIDDIKKVFDALKSFVKEYEKHSEDYLDRNEYLIENFWYIELLNTFNDWSNKDTDFFQNYKVISQHEVVLRRKSKIRHDLAIFTDHHFGVMQKLLLSIEIKKDSDSKNIVEFEDKQLESKQTLLEDYKTLIESINNKEPHFGLAIIFTNLKGLDTNSFSTFLHNLKNKAKVNSKRVAVCIVNNNKILLGIEGKNLPNPNKLIKLWKNMKYNE